MVGLGTPFLCHRDSAQLTISFGESVLSFVGVAVSVASGVLSVLYYDNRLPVSATSPVLVYNVCVRVDGGHAHLILITI